MVMIMVNKSVMFLLFLLSLGNIAISGLWKSLLEFTLFYFDLFKVDLSPYFQLHKPEFSSACRAFDMVQQTVFLQDVFLSSPDMVF